MTESCCNAVNHCLSQAPPWPLPAGEPCSPSHPYPTSAGQGKAARLGGRAHDTDVVWGPTPHDNKHSRVNV